jgi:ketosteroid isomerase-like protein
MITRKLSSIALVFVMLCSACSSETVARPPPPPVNWNVPPPRVTQDAGLKATEMERVAAEAYIKGLNSLAFVQLPPALDENAHFAFVRTKDAHGRDQVVQAHDALFGAFDQRTFVMSRVWLTDSAHVLEWTMTGIQAREWRGVAATHKPVSIKGVTLLWTNDDGFITDVHVIFDEAVVKAQLGVGPKVLVSLSLPQTVTGPRQEFEQTGTSAEDANLIQLRASLDALRKGDETAYLSTMTEDVEVSTLESAQPLRGRESVRGYFRTIRKAIDQIDPTIDNAWGIGPFAIVEYSLVGEQIGPIGWIPRQRNPVLKMVVVDIAEMHDGKIARLWRYDDPSQIISSP